MTGLLKSQFILGLEAAKFDALFSQTFMHVIPLPVPGTQVHFLYHVHSIYVSVHRRF